VGDVGKIISWSMMIAGEVITPATSSVCDTSEKSLPPTENAWREHREGVAPGVLSARFTLLPQGVGGCWTVMRSALIEPSPRWQEGVVRVTDAGKPGEESSNAWPINAAFLSRATEEMSTEALMAFFQSVLDRPVESLL